MLEKSSNTFRFSAVDLGATIWYSICILVVLFVRSALNVKHVILFLYHEHIWPVSHKYRQHVSVQKDALVWETFFVVWN